MANYLVTGGAGFIGSNIVEALVKQGEAVKVLDNCTTGKLSNLKNVVDKIEFIHGDIRDLSLVNKAVKDMDYVIHQAALSSVSLSIEDPIATNEVNVTGTLNVLTAARDAGVKRVIYACSAAVYGNSENLLSEDTVPNPISPYAVSKYTGEQYCKVFYDLYDLETVSLRYFNVFGPRQNINSQYAAVIPIFIKSFLEKRQPTIFGDGEQSRDFTFVENVVSANLLACHKEGVGGQVFNIACGERTTINDLVKIIGSILNVNIEPIYKQKRKGDIKHSYADINKARKLLNYEPLIDLITGIERTISKLSYLSGLLAK